MSCSSCTNSISVSGAASPSLSRSSSMISSAERSRSPRGLSRTRMSPVFCWVANRPSSDPVRRRTRDFGGVGRAPPRSSAAARRCLRAPCPPASGSRSRSPPSSAAGRKPEPTLQVADHRPSRRAGARRRREHRPLQPARQRRRVGAIDARRARSAGACAPRWAGAPRARAAESASATAPAKPAPRPTASSTSALKNWPTTPESSPSGANTTTVVSVDPTIGAINSSVAASIAVVAAFLAQAAMNVLHHDDGIVDDEADRHGQAAHRHQVDRLAEQPHQEERGEHGERQRAWRRPASAASRAGTRAGPAPRGSRR